MDPSNYVNEPAEYIEPSTAAKVLLVQLGAFYGWCHLARRPVDYWDWLLLYWKPAPQANVKCHAPVLRRLGRWSGYRSFDRGRH